MSKLTDLLLADAYIGGGSGGGGGEWVKELIWENPDTTADVINVAFEQDAWKKYDYILWSVQNSTTEANRTDLIADVKSIKSQMELYPSNVTYGGFIAARGSKDDNWIYKRGLQFYTNGKWYITPCNKISESSPSYPSLLIPVSVYGIKKG